MPSHVITSGLNANEIALCGGIAGIAARFVIAPFDVVKIRLQLQSLPRLGEGGFGTPGIKYTGILNTMKVIAAEEGFLGFFKGNASAEYLYLTYGAAQFYTYYHMNDLLQKENLKMLAPVKSFLCGMVSGSVATTLTYPFDLLRTRFAMQGTRTVYHSMSHAISDIYYNEGIRGFYRGLTPSVIQIMPYMGLMFYTYESLCTAATWFKKHGWTSENHKRIDDMLCGSLAAIISKTGVYPLDVLRKRLQVQGPHRLDYVVSSIPHYAQNSSMLSCFQTIVRTEGVRALYRGLAPSLLKVGPVGAVNFVVFEIAKDTLKQMKEEGAMDELHLPDTTTLTA